LVIEDDYWGDIAQAACGSLFSDSRLRERTIYVRSFAKSLGPDLRLAIVAAPQHLRLLLRDARLATDGWNSRISQRVVAQLLASPAAEKAFNTACLAYSERRVAVVEGIKARLPSACVLPGTDGLNVWVELPPGSDALDVLHHAAQFGVIVSSGEAFYTSPRHHTAAIRLSIGMVDSEDAFRAGELLASAILAVDTAAPVSIVM
jgi:GntR family transcriptional regulator/MocR family aminotransferase